MRVIGWVLVLVLAAVAALTLDPEWLGRVNDDWAGLTTTYPVNQVIALRPLLAGVFAVSAIIVLVVGVVRKVGFHGGNRTLVLGLVLAAVAVGHGWFLWDRGLDNRAELTADPGLRPDDPGDGSLTVLSYNTRDGDTGVDDIAAAAETNGVDVLVLTETSAELADQVAAFLAGGGESFQVFTAAAGEDVTGATAVLVSSSLGEYVQTTGPATELGAVRVEPATGVGPVVVGVHVVPPASDNTDRWLRDLRAVRGLCTDRGPAGLVLAGDLNATLDHAPLQDLGRCTAAAVDGGVGGIATWPARLPSLIGSTIDHVLVDGDSFETTEALVVDRGDSDHRGLVVRVRPVDQTS
ncbi:endonuclease/exonuclease/phosphatase family protein [Georgenia subflava]|uniref:endonuclease/exonuclease/phosphatase family protein n=1 Tax=Georgenia subflava TaxID=1622177 RepID=UPI00186AEA47|nr:endonuclease/exonuclease/phosphatase family protein [Georgenia subflava]